MKTTMSFIAALAFGSVLTGCGTATKVVNTNAESVSIVFDGDQSTIPEVNKLAAQECQKNGRMAVLRDISPVEDGRIANFECRRSS